MAQEAKKGFIFYYDYRKHLALLSDAERGQLLTALLDYGACGIEPKLEGAAAMAFSFIQAQKDRDAEKYAETVRKRSEAGKKGGRPPKKAETEKATENTEKQEKAKKANAFPEKQEKANENKKSLTDTDTDTVTDTVTDIYNNPPLPPSGGKSSDVQEERFETFWAEYPKKVGKKAAFTSWKRLKPTAELFEHIMQAVKAAKNSEQWERENGRYIPNPSTWLNQGRWDDELNERRSATHGELRPNIERPENGTPARSETALSGFHMA